MKTMAKKQQVDAVNRYLAFSLSGEEYAVPLLSVKEVIGIPEITPIPFAPPHFLGIMNLRGQIVSVLDLRTKFGMKEAARSEESALIILNLDPIFLGVVVDSVNKVIGVLASEISDPPELLDVNAAAFLTGVARKEDKLILLLDIVKTLDIEDLAAIEQNSKAAA
jgi:purine-binding chemotaxis protein CheW